MRLTANNSSPRNKQFTVPEDEESGLPLVESTTLLEVGDQYTLTFDRSFLEIDHLVFTGIPKESFTSLFPLQKIFLGGLDKTKKPVEFKADHENLALIRKGLCKHFLSCKSEQLVLKVSTLDPLTYELIPPVVITANEIGEVLSSAPVTVQAGWESVLTSLSLGMFTNNETFRFHEEACTLDLCQPLDKIVSLATLPDFVPYPHQVQAVKAVISRFRGRALLCDEVGLGKTIEACLVLLEYLQRGLIKTILVLAPPSLTGQWQEELRSKFSLDFVINDEERFEGWDKHSFMVASLATAKLKPHCELLSKQEFDLVIVDEAHHLKNRNTKAWQLINHLKKRYILFLTATPMQNGLSDLYSLVTLLKPGHLKTYQEFKRQFVSTRNEFEPRNLDQSRGLLQGVMIRNKRVHTNIILSKRHARTIELDLNREEVEFYQRITHLVRRGAFRETSTNKGLIDTFTLQLLQLEAGSSVPACLPTLSKLISRSLPSSYEAELKSVYAEGKSLSENYLNICRKANAVTEIIARYNDKVIIFTRFQETQRFLHQFLSERGINTSQFHGGMRRVEKELEIERFKNETQVLISLESGGEGRNLQFCRALINYDLPWNPMKIEQRIGRIHRLGQDKDVHIFNLAARNTAESYVLTLLDKKINLFELVVGEVDMILGNLNEDKDFEEILFEIWAQSQDDNEVTARLDELGQKLLSAKAQYLRSQKLDDQVFGDTLLTA